MSTLEPDIAPLADADEASLSQVVPLRDDDTPAFASLLRQVARTPGDEKLIETDAELAPGAVVAERFEVAREIGRGGFGRVYEAHDRVLSRPVALKLLHPRRALSDQQLALFYREAQATARLNHPNIVTVHDWGEWSGMPFLVLELLDGEPFSTLVARGPVPEARAFSICRDVARALAYAHAHGVLHLDLKTQNVFVAADGRVKVLDFGLAGLEWDDEVPARIAGGTPATMAPEQADSGPTDARTDIWAVGVILHELLFGRRHGRPAAEGATIPIPAGASRAAGRLLERTLVRDPAARFSDAPALVEALDAAIGRRARSSHRTRARAAWTAAMVALAVLGGLWLRPAPRPAPPLELTRLTSTSGLNADPALSPDGRLLAYASDRGGGGGLDIWVQPIGGGEPVQLTTEPADDAEPAFSPDGTQIVFSRRDTGLFVISALGGSARLIARAECPRTPRFSPDGRWIAYWTGFPATVVAGGIPDALGSISIVAASGGEPRVLRPRVASARYPVWSPDGERILFLGEEDPDGKVFDWYIVKRDGSDLIKTGAVPKIPAAGVSAGSPIPAAWSRNRDAVVFATNEVGSSSLWEISISPTTGHVTGSPRRLTFGTAIERSPSVASSGRIAFSSVVENVDIWRVPLDEYTGVATGPLERVTDSPASDRLRGVSSDGKTLLFISSRTNADEVWVRDIPSGAERQVTRGGADDATLSPDGSRFLFSRVEAGTRSLAIGRTDGGPPATLCVDCGVPGGWSPDGRVVLVGKGVPSRLTVYDVSTGEQTELTAHPRWSLQQSHFSPDARWVAFHTTNSPNVRQVYVTPALAGSSRVPQQWLPVVDDHGCHPSWSNDGSLLYYFSFRDGAFCPWVQRLDPETKRPIGPPRPVLHLHNPRLRAATGAAATNDVQAGYLYLTATEATGNIWMLAERRD